MTSFLSRGCDSRNLNLSPLCDLKNPTKPSIWAEDIGASYPEVPAYIDPALQGLMRRAYPVEMQGNEIIQDLVGGNTRVLLAYNLIQDTTVEYDAFEKDIAVATFYFGRATALGGFVCNYRDFYHLLVQSMSDPSG